METRQLELCFARAARPARERLARDRARVTDVRVGRFLAYLEEHLFATSFSVRSAFSSLELRDNNLSTTVRTQIGEAPRAYVNRLRFETAVRLLSEGAPSWQVGQLIGFQTVGGFRAGFKRQSGVSPKRFQELVAAASELARQAHGPEPIEAAVGDELSAAARRILLLWLTETFPQERQLLQLADRLTQAGAGEASSSPSSTDGVTIPVDLITDRIALELPAVRLLWQELRELPFDRQVKLLRQRADFKSPVLFLFLREASRIFNRDDRAKGLQLARLALVSVRLLELLKFDDHTSENQVLAWSWLGNVHRLSLDFERAEKAFVAAEEHMPRAGCRPLVEGDFCFLKAELRWYQRKFDKALKLVERAVELFSGASLFRLHCEAIIFRAMVLFCLDRAEESIEDLQQALKWLDPTTSPMQCLSARHQLTRCFIAIGDEGHAITHLVEAKKLNRRIRSRYYKATLDWLEGLTSFHGGDLAQAEKHLLRARHHYTEIDRPEHVAVLAIDLAAVFARQGALDKAALLTTEAVPVIRRLPFVDEAEMRKTLAFIRDAVGGTELSPERVEELREKVQQMLRTHPAFVLDDSKRRKT